MVKPIVLLALFICFVYSDNEINLDNFHGLILPPDKIQTQTKLGGKTKKNLPTIEDYFIEEVHNTKPCKKDTIGISSDSEEPDISTESALPMIATMRQLNKIYPGNNYAADTFYGYNPNNANTNTKIDLHDNSKRNDCIFETNRNNKDFKSVSTNKKEPVNDISSNLMNVERIDENNPIVNTNHKKCTDTILYESLPSTRRILPGLIKNPTEQELEDYKYYQNKPKFPYKNNVTNYRRNLFPNPNTITNNYDSENVNERNANELADQKAVKKDAFESKIMEPTKGKGIFDMKDTRVTLLENSRVCYACSSMSNPTCLSPDKRTTVKYCRKGQQSCVTKTYQHKGTLLVIRDCDSYCINLNTPNDSDKYSTCQICHTDLCNGASTITIFNTGVAMIVLFGILFNTS